MDIIPDLEFYRDPTLLTDRKYGKYNLGEDDPDHKTYAERRAEALEYLGKAPRDELAYSKKPKKVW